MPALDLATLAIRSIQGRGDSRDQEIKMLTITLYVFTSLTALGMCLSFHYRAKYSQSKNTLKQNEERFNKFREGAKSDKFRDLEMLRSAHASNEVLEKENRRFRTLLADLPDHAAPGARNNGSEGISGASTAPSVDGTEIDAQRGQSGAAAEYERGRQAYRQLRREYLEARQTQDNSLHSRQQPDTQGSGFEEVVVGLAVSDVDGYTTERVSSSGNGGMREARQGSAKKQHSVDEMQSRENQPGFELPDSGQRLQRKDTEYLPPNPEAAHRSIRQVGKERSLTDSKRAKRDRQVKEEMKYHEGSQWAQLDEKMEGEFAWRQQLPFHQDDGEDLESNLSMVAPFSSLEINHVNARRDVETKSGVHIAMETDVVQGN
ncbi:hypothetical protein G7Z17_g9526 [Cylindrodendrum hubeiense]|uniref:Uncharacterized protein n=1 Tax=Cylindrodendrum hubeiense TaxID=595255 RepID=A0A9P5H362_9HYPO|nr:hypothetical protein G7Z17_g9526 [Cylindrodendrum hubeiense]